MSCRYVEADTGRAAVALVAQSIVDSMDLTPTEANSTIQRTYDACGPIKKKHLLAALDTLVDPKRRNSVRAERRRLARSILQGMDRRAWLRDRAREAPPLVDPERLDDLIRLSEIQHIERNIARVRTWERPSPLHD